MERIKADTIPADKMYVCPLGIEAAGRKMPLGKSDMLQLLSCSDAIPLKRIESIVDGLAHIDEDRICWTHIGDGEELEKIKTYAKEKLGKKSNICYTLMGHMDHRQVIQYYETRQVDCFITTSSTEGVSVSKSGFGVDLGIDF